MLILCTYIQSAFKLSRQIYALLSFGCTAGNKKTLVPFQLLDFKQPTAYIKGEIKKKSEPTEMWIPYNCNCVISQNLM